MKVSKLLLSLLILSASSVAFAEGEAPAGANHDAMKQEHFAKMKETMLANHDKRIQIIQDSKACIQAAAEPSALKACMEKEKAAHDQFKASSEANRDAMKKEMDAKREAFKQQREANKPKK